jgi:hypothetical protein
MTGASHPATSPSIARHIEGRGRRKPDFAPNRRQGRRRIPRCWRKPTQASSGNIDFADPATRLFGSHDRGVGAESVLTCASHRVGGLDQWRADRRAAVAC